MGKVLPPRALSGFLAIVRTETDISLLRLVAGDRNLILLRPESYLESVPQFILPWDPINPGPFSFAWKWSVVRAGGRSTLIPTTRFNPRWKYESELNGTCVSEHFVSPPRRSES